MKKISILFIICCILSACGIRSFRSNPSVHLELNGYNLADSKLFDDVILSSSGGHLIFFDFNGNIIKEYEDVPVNWMYALPEAGLIIAGNSNKEIRKIKMDSDYTILSNDIIVTSENLMIDPTVIKIEEGNWLLTYVEIEGNVNNSDINSENGLYTVHLLESEDLMVWNEISVIVSQNNNIEDGDMFEYKNRLFYLYEIETYDKRPSRICMKYSEDQGISWSNEIILIPDNADNEMAASWIEDDWLILYYSSDLNEPGASYNGAEVYKAEFKLDFSETELSIPVDIAESEGILLYDVKKEKDDIRYLYSRNYLTENILVLR